MEDKKKDYLITIAGKGKRREIHLSAFAFNFGIFLIMISAFIFIGTCSYSVYSALHHQQNNEIVRSVQRAGELQQEQLLTISKKAVSLSETIQNLAQQEEELRIQAGLEKPAKDDKIEAENNSEDEIPELEEIKPIEGLPTPEDLPALEEIPAMVEIPAPKSEWISPADGGYSGVQIQAPATVETPSEIIEKPVENPAVVEKTSEVPAPVEVQIQSEWISPADGGYSGTQIQMPAVVELPVENIQTPDKTFESFEFEMPESVWSSPNEGGYISEQLNPPVPLEIPAPQSEWLSPNNGGYLGIKPKKKPSPLHEPSRLSNSVPVIMTFPEKVSNFFGQGGPLPNLELADVSEALSMIEQRVAIRLESLDEFQTELKLRREQMSTILAVPNNPVGTYGTVVIDNGFANDLSLDLGQFGGSPSANPNVPSIWPTTGVVTSPYGLRWGGSDFHPGIDIANDMGTPIVATADGIVEYAGWNAGGYGNMVDINHGNGLMTRYGHASQVVVTVGQSVKRGQLIAYMGSTGFSTGPHVHYEVHVNGQRVNPISYL